MAQSFKKEFILAGFPAHVIKRKSGKGFCYEIRYRRNGYNISASSTSLEIAKALFITKTHEATHKPKTVTKFTFKTISEEWFEIKSKRWHPDTTRNYRYYLNKYIYPAIADDNIKDIRSAKLNNIMKLAEGKGRTYEDIRSTLNQVFKYAGNNGIISHNPVAVIEFIRAERKHGKALTIEEERYLIEQLQLEKYRQIKLPLLTALFYGLRPSEINTARFEGNFLIAQNKKRKKGKIEYKKIPTSEQSKAFIQPGTIKLPCNTDNLNLWLKKILPDYKLYDLRHTFTTRCRQFVSSDIVSIWIGDSQQNLVDNTYTHLSDDYMIQQMKRVNYLNDLFPNLFPKH